MLYVRSEVQPGSEKPEHLFVTAHDRTVLTRWLKVLPAELELVHDTEGRKQAAEQQWLTVVAEHERDIAYRLLKKATAWLPRERVRGLRDEWRNAQPVEEVQ
jgi:hypothetical protein